MKTNLRVIKFPEYKTVFISVIPDDDEEAHATSLAFLCFSFEQVLRVFGRIQLNEAQHFSEIDALVKDCDIETFFEENPADEEVVFEGGLACAIHSIALSLLEYELPIEYGFDDAGFMLMSVPINPFGVFFITGDDRIDRAYVCYSIKQIAEFCVESGKFMSGSVDMKIFQMLPLIGTEKKMCKLVSSGARFFMTIMAIIAENQDDDEEESALAEFPESQEVN